MRAPTSSSSRCLGAGARVCDPPARAHDDGGPPGCCRTGPVPGSGRALSRGSEDRPQRLTLAVFFEVTLTFFRPDFLAVTRTESFLPASLAVTLYVFLVAPLTAFLPRSHW